MRIPHVILLSSLVSLSMAGRFIDDFYHFLRVKYPNNNVFSSAFSIKLALGMLYMGAEGGTAEEIRQVIGLEGKKPEAVQWYKDLMAIFLHEKKVMNVVLLNRMYVNTKLGVAPDFNKQVEEPFLSKVEAIDMSNPVKASGDISKAIDEQTSGQIKAMVLKTHIVKNPRALVLNAFYLKVKWQQNFTPSKLMGNFRLKNGQKVAVKMIRRFGTVHIGDFPELGARVIELPFANSSLYMNIFLPKTLNGLQTVQQAIIGFNHQLDTIWAEVQIPYFKFAFGQDVKPILDMMGAQSMFSPTLADLSLIFANKAKGGVDGFIHKGVIEVDHSAADTVPSPLPNGKDKFLYRFTVDLPFAFTIRDRTTIYFQGQVNNPKLK